MRLRQSPYQQASQLSEEHDIMELRNSRLKWGQVTKRRFLLEMYNPDEPGKKFKPIFGFVVFEIWHFFFQETPKFWNLDRNFGFFGRILEFFQNLPNILGLALQFKNLHPSFKGFNLRKYTLRISKKFCIHLKKIENKRNKVGANWQQSETDGKAFPQWTLRATSVYCGIFLA